MIWKILREVWSNPALKRFERLALFIGLASVTIPCWACFLIWLIFSQ